MNNLLLDSHSYVWLLYHPNKIGKASRGMLKSSNRTYFSLISLFELKIKYALGKFSYLPDDIINSVYKSGLATLAIKEQHILNLLDIKINDPFDKLLLTQAKYEGAQFLTADELILNLDLPFVSDIRV